MKKILCLCVSLMAGTLIASDPQDKPPLPAGPIIKPMPELSEWTIVFAAPQTPKAGQSPSPASTPETGGHKEAAKRPTIITVTKSGKTYRQVETDPEGRKITRWKINGYEVFIDANGKSAVARVGDGSDFGELGWISSKNYVSVTKVGGVNCFIFQDKIRIPEERESVDATAAVSMDSQQPVYFTSSSEYRTYVFGPQPTTPLTVPPEILSVVETRQKSLNAMLRHP